MADLISREAALDLLRYHPIKNPEPTDVIPAVLETARKFIAKLPAVDAVEVVRCRECKHWDVEGLYCHHPAGLSYCGKTGAQKGFCCFGERRGENG